VISGSRTLLLFGADDNSGGHRLLLLLRYVPVCPLASGMVMIGSLKAYAPRLASRLGTTPAALYERQRALVRAGLLTQPEGRGPGSGVPVRPYEVALLLIAVLATDSLSDTSEKVRLVSMARSRANDNACPLTGEQTFVEAVARVLDMSHDHWREIGSITVHRTTGAGSISYKSDLHAGSYKGDLHAGSSFFSAIRRAPQSRGPATFIVDASLTRDLIIQIASDLKEIADSERLARAAALQRAAPAETGIEPRVRRSVRESTPAKKRKKK